MLNIDNKITIKESNGNTTLTINDASFFNVEFKIERFIEEKEMIKFIKNIERQVRSSPEYRNLMTYFKTELNFNSCIYLNNLTGAEISIEMHHNPFTLFDIVQIIITKYENENIPFNSFLIASDVMLLHYKNLVGLVPLSKSIHELVHSNPQFVIHKDLHIGKIDAFYDVFKDHMTEDQKLKYNSWIKYAEDFKDDKFNGLSLFDQNKRNVYLNSIDDVNEQNSQIAFNDDDDEDYPEIEGINKC